MASLPESCDVLVVGGGNAGFSAAIEAKEAGGDDLSVVLIDKCPEDWAGGNSYFTAGAMRTVHNGLPDLLPLVNNVDDELAKITDIDPYTTADFGGDMDKVCHGQSDPELTRILISDSLQAVKWLAAHGVRFQLSYNRQAFLVEGRHKFWGGLALKTQDGGKGLIEDHRAAAKKAGIRVFFSTPATGLIRGSRGEMEGIVLESGCSLKAKATILTAGGFEANAAMRLEHLGKGWDLACVRGTPYNTGDLLQAAVQDVSAKTAGQWSGCHSTCWDANAPRNSGDRNVSNEFTKSGYPLGIMINTDGERFVDEGIEYRNFTYAIFGRAILGQPNGLAFQVWDQQTIPWLRNEEYRDEVVTKFQADTIEELAQMCSKVGLTDPVRFADTIKRFNSAVSEHRKLNPGLTWNPAVKDGLSTQSSSDASLALAKSNWALPIDKPPYLAIRVTGGVTFTFGGLAVNSTTSAVLSTEDQEIPGLYCAGEMLGGLFWDNYPGGSGLTSGTVFGRRAGAAAVRYIQTHA